MHYLRQSPMYFPFAASLLGACVMSNPAWDPPTAEAQAETGVDDDAETGDGWGIRHDLPYHGDDAETGDGDLTGDGDATGDGDPSGDGDEGPQGDDDGDGDGDGKVCGDAAPSFGPCPPSCDECHDGVCYRYCSAGECHDDFLLCPVSWSCRIKCIGKDSCKDATLACTGWGSCDVECVGENACSNADIVCAAGPCEVTCGGDADKHPCDHLDVKCGSDNTKLRCEEPYEGSGPSLSDNKFNECECTSDCTEAD